MVFYIDRRKDGKDEADDEIEILNEPNRKRRREEIDDGSDDEIEILNEAEECQTAIVEAMAISNISVPANVTKIIVVDYGICGVCKYSKTRAAHAQGTQILQFISCSGCGTMDNVCQDCVDDEFGFARCDRCHRRLCLCCKVNPGCFFYWCVEQEGCIVCSLKECADCQNRFCQSHIHEIKGQMKCRDCRDGWVLRDGQYIRKETGLFI